MGVKLKDSDKNILARLKQDAREDLSSIAGDLKMSPETCRYRVQRMEDKGVIDQYLTVLNTEITGEQRTVYYTDRPWNEQVDADSVVWSGRLIGQYNTVFDWIGEGAPPFSMESYQALDVERRIINTHPTRKQGTNYALSDTQRDILNVLTDNPRASYVDMGEAAGVSAPTALRNVRKLKDNDVIIGYTVHVNPGRLDKTWCNVRARCDRRTIASLAERVTTERRVAYLYQYAPNGDVDLDIGIYFDNPADLANIIQRLTEHESLRVVGTNLPLEADEADTARV